MIYPAAAVLLAHVRPSTTAAVEAYAAPDGQAVEITRIVVTNTTNSIAHASMWHDDAGSSTFTADTASHLSNTPIPKDGSTVIEARAIGTGIVLSPGGQIGVKTFTADALTFSFYGILESRAQR